MNPAIEEIPSAKEALAASTTNKDSFLMSHPEYMAKYNDILAKIKDAIANGYTSVYFGDHYFGWHSSNDDVIISYLISLGYVVNWTNYGDGYIKWMAQAKQ